MRALVAALVSVFLLGGCAKHEERILPQQSAQKFWDAMAKGDLKLAKAMTIRGRLEEPLLKVELLDAEATGARMVQGRAFVPTHLRFRIPFDSLKSAECNATMETELLKVEGRWLIDDVVTMQNYDEALQKGAAQCTSKMLQKALQKGMKNFESVKKELEREFFGIAKEFEKSFKQMQEQLRESLERMQKELHKEPPPKLPEPQEGQKI